MSASTPARADTSAKTRPARSGRCGWTSTTSRPADDPAASGPTSISGCPSSRRSSSPPAYPLAPATAAVIPMNENLYTHNHDHASSPPAIWIEVGRVGTIEAEAAQVQHRSRQKVSINVPGLAMDCTPVRRLPVRRLPVRRLLEQTQDRDQVRVRVTTASEAGHSWLRPRRTVDAVKHHRNKRIAPEQTVRARPPAYTRDRDVRPTHEIGTSRIGGERDMTRDITAATTAFAALPGPLAADPPASGHVMARRATARHVTAGRVVRVPAGPVVAAGPSHRTGPR